MKSDHARTKETPPPDPQDGASELNCLLTQILAHLKRYIVFPTEDSAIACALWVPHTWVIHAFDFSPYLQISSPVKECGKTRLFKCLENLCARSWFAILPSEAVLFRKIAASCPTLLLDETDALFTDRTDPNKEAIRAVLNAGFERGAVVPRCVGQQHALMDFPVYCAKGFAGIGKIPETVASRSLRIMLHRRKKHQEIEKFRKREVAQVALPIKEGLVKWSSGDGVIEQLRAARPHMPAGLGDRSEDICEPLFAIADLAGGEWPALARRALVNLRAKGASDDDNVRILLLAAIREIRQNWLDDAIFTRDLLVALVRREGEPWGAWWRKDVEAGNISVAATKLAGILGHFEIVPRTVRVWYGREGESDVGKGYPFGVFDDVFASYLPPIEPSEPVPPSGPLG
jgi:hypothetical protein